jgi:hypothetical protein
MSEINKKQKRSVPRSVPMPVLKDFDRLTVTQSVNHEHRGEPPKSVVVGYSRTLEYKEEPYQRRFSVPGTWTPIDLGWMPSDKVGCVVLENLEGRSHLVNPTDEERKEIEAKVLEVSYHQDSKACDLIRPGASDIKWPSDASKLYVRCQSGTASCRISVISK